MRRGNIYLTGMMGCGKSTCARLLSESLHRPMVDTDQRIEENAGMTISEIFQTQGEKYFRRLETELLWTLSDREDLIVACGGGMPLAAENRAIFRESGTVIFLNRDVEKIYEGLDVSGRPLGQDGKQAFLTRFAGRKPLYEAAADIIIGDYPTAAETVEAILEALEGQP